MPRSRARRGKSLPIGAPEWEPLLNLAPDHVDDFMWMYSVELTDGTRLQVYKHYWTRNSLHLDNEGRAFVYVETERYKEVNADWLLSRVLAEDLRTKSSVCDSFVRHNYGPNDLRLDWARSATKHRISRDRSRHVIEHCGLWFWRRPPRRAPDFDQRDDQVLFFGDDADGVALEVFAAWLAEGELLVIHAMRVRDHHLALYEEAKQWQKR
jgi:hypothetical protein